MTTNAGCARVGQIVVVINVALRALHGGMSARERESGGGVIKGRAGPGRRVMALSASLRETRGHVARIRCALEILQMATDAGGICTGQVVIAIDVALGALHGRVSARERESRR